MEPTAPRADSIGALALLAAVTCWLLAPGPAFFDSGELAATAIELGVPHPTGFPLFNLFGHVLTLVPVGPIALRVHLSCALCACAAVLLWTRALGGGVPSSGRMATVALAAIAALPLTAASVLRHVRAAEVYPLVWLHAAAVVFVAVRWRAGRRVAGHAALVAAAAGLHAESVLIGAGFLAFSGWSWVRSRGFGPVLRSVVVLLPAGLLIVAVVVYLPLAAARPAAFSWGDVQEPTRLWQHLTAASIRAAFAGRIAGPGFVAATGQLLAGWWRDVGWLLPAAAVGAVWLLRARRSAALATLAVLLIDAVYSVVLNPMGLRDEQCGLLLAIGSLILAAAAFVAIGNRLAGASRLAPAALVLALVAVPVTRALALLDARPAAELTSGARLGDLLLDDMPPGGLLVVASDHAASACVHAQVAVGARPDALCVPGVFGRDATMLRVLARSGRDGFVQAAIQARDGRTSRDMAGVLGEWLRPALRDVGTIGWELGNPTEDAQVIPRWTAGFPAGTVHGATLTEALHRRRLAGGLERLMRWCARDVGACPIGGDAAQLAARWASVTAARLMLARRRGAGQLLDVAVRLAPQDPAVLNNVAVHRLGKGQPQAALAACRQALQSDATYAAAHRTAARAALLTGDRAAALRHAKQYLAAAPGSAARKRWFGALFGDDAVDGI